ADVADAQAQDVGQSAGIARHVRCHREDPYLEVGRRKPRWSCRVVPSYIARNRPRPRGMGNTSFDAGTRLGTKPRRAGTSVTVDRLEHDLPRNTALLGEERLPGV